MLTAPVLRGQEPSAFLVPPAMLEADSVSLYDFAGYFCDSTNHLEFEDLREMRERFVPLGPPGRKFDNRYLHWVYFRIDNRGSADTLRRYLFSYFPYRSYWFQADSGGLTQKGFGTVSHNIRDFEGCSYLLPVNFPSGEDIHCFVQLDDRLSLPKRKRSSYGLNILSVEKGRDWIQWAMEDRYQIRLMLAMFLGILLFMVLFTGLMYLQNRERIYLHYALYVGSIFLLYAVRRSYEFQTPFAYITQLVALPVSHRGPVDLFGLCQFHSLLSGRHGRAISPAGQDTESRDGFFVGPIGAGFPPETTVAPSHLFCPFRKDPSAAFYIRGMDHLPGLPVAQSPVEIHHRGYLCPDRGVLVVLITDLIRERTGLDLQSRPFSYAQMGVVAEILIFALGLGYRARMLREEKMRAELRALKAQMNPHFVFNSLNAIRHLIQKSKPEDAANYLTKFARLFRGILEHSDREKITLEEELEFCRDYLSIEALRFDRGFRFRSGGRPRPCRFSRRPADLSAFFWKTPSGTACCRKRGALGQTPRR
ncbi:MAG: histidine kinase [Saprospirales bacterium]|nr:histidine kinase [Saprospirales bacterium]